MSYYNYSASLLCSDRLFLHNNTIKLQTLFWEIKNRFVYILFSFFLSFIIAYQKRNVLLYLFILSYTKKDADPSFFDFFFKEIRKERVVDSDIPISVSSGQTWTYLPTKHSFVNEDLTIDYNTWLSAYKETLCKCKDFILSLAAPEGAVAQHIKDAVQRATFLKQESMGDSNLLFNNQYLSALKESSLIDFSTLISSIDYRSVNFIFTDVEEAFSSQILICLIFSSLLVLPLFIYNLLTFFIPSLYFYESRKWIIQSFIYSGVWFYFTIIVQNKIIPRFAAFLLEFSIRGTAFNVLAETKIYSYCNWAFSIFLVTNFIFFFFCLIFFLIKNDKIKIEFLRARRKLCNVILLLFSALIAPPDLFTQLSFTILLIFFFELSLFLFSIYKHLLNLNFRS